MNFFSIKTSHQESIKSLLRGTSIMEFKQLSWHRTEVKLGDFVFLVISGDKSKKEINYENGLRALSEVVTLPLDDGSKHFKIKVKILELFEESISRDDFYKFPELKNAPSIGPITTNEPNQSFRKIDNQQAIAILKATKKILNKSEFPSKIEILLDSKSIIELISNDETKANTKKEIKYSTKIMDFWRDCSSSNIIYSESLVKRFISSLISKNFLLLTGLSGSGKTKLALAFGKWISSYKQSKFALLKKAIQNEIFLENYKIVSLDRDFLQIINLKGSTGKIIPIPVKGIFEWFDLLKNGEIDINGDPKEIRHEVGERSIYQKHIHGFYTEFFKVASLMMRESTELKTGNFILIPVGADWTNREPLLGYPNALNENEYIKPENGALDLLIEANDNPDLPYFLILDEMNLSHVERYFADFLSAMESGEEIFLHNYKTPKSGIPSKINIPKNLFIIGTVNIDETTHMFSPKVLDRANTIEFRITPNEMTKFFNELGEINMENLESKGAGMAKSFLDMALDTNVPTEGIDDVKEQLGKFFVELKKVGAEFGYRSATEILKLIDRLGKIDPDLEIDEKLDIAVIQKLLPKLHGSRRKLVPVLTSLANLCLKDSIKSEIENTNIENKVFEVDSEKIKYPLSFEKLSRMHRAAVENGFASFAEA
ncbi:hypothetical protein E4S40_02370 [Algoriphagus kandeliae]|uniref:Uncharacterized protein n=1 Tax=Algoriphagus kandeliae TaxID=2562278 RepID=A0A4Y9QZK4_9BACT|nr:hypothetical protein [Algoriphagus kandeliae]TFV97520.1 hypothetical protein E4S40_02370 [Algoriphagus kandeliae]